MKKRTKRAKLSDQYGMTTLMWAGEMTEGTGAKQKDTGAKLVILVRNIGVDDEEKLAAVDYEGYLFSIYSEDADAKTLKEIADIVYDEMMGGEQE